MRTGAGTTFSENAADLSSNPKPNHGGGDDCSAASQDLPGMTAEEQALLSQLRDQKQAAEFVYKALQRAEHAATAAATASGLPPFNAAACTLYLPVVGPCTADGFAVQELLSVRDSILRVTALWCVIWHIECRHAI